MKKWMKIVLIPLVLALLLYGIWALTMDPYRGTVKEELPSAPLEQILTKEQAVEDLQQILRLLQTRHAGWKLDDPNAELTEDLLLATMEILPEELTVLELWQRINAALYHLGDGHTMAIHIPEHRLYLSDWSAFSRYGTPVAINGKDAEQFFAERSTLLPAETEAYARHQILCQLPRQENWMNFLGVDTTDGVWLTFDTPDGKQTMEYAYVLPELVKGTEEEPWVSWEIDPAHSAAVFTLKSCTVNAEYEAALAEFFTEVRLQEIDNVVVDLRGNGGGNSYVANLFLEYLDVAQYRTWDSDVRLGWYLHKNRNNVCKNKRQPDAFAGTVYVLTDTETFSAAKDFAMLLADNDLAVHVGQAPGNLPDAYMDVLQFRLENSGLSLWVSYKRAYRIDSTQSGKPLEPDIATDDALQTVYDIIKNAGS